MLELNRKSSVHKSVKKVCFRLIYTIKLILLLLLLKALERGDVEVMFDQERQRELDEAQEKMKVNFGNFETVSYHLNDFV